MWDLGSRIFAPLLHRLQGRENRRIQFISGTGCISASALGSAISLPNGTVSRQVTGLTKGTYSFRITGIDTSGNSSAACSKVLTVK